MNVFGSGFEGHLAYICNIRFDLLQVFFSALIDVAGHAKMLDEAFRILQDAKSQGIRLGTISYSSLMGACCNVCAFYCCSKSFIDEVLK